MLKLNLKLFFRNIKKNKSIFSINIIGLTGGLVSALLIFLWATNELEIDKFTEKDSKRHVQVVVNYHTATTVETNEHTPGPMTMALGEEISEVDYAIPVVAPRSFYFGVLSSEEQNIKAKPQFIGDGFFNVFGCDFIAGNKSNALTDKQSIVISETMALGLFKETANALGKTVTFKNEYFDGVYTITGIFKLPANTSDEYDILFNFEKFLEGRPNLKKWNNGGVEAHLVLLPGVSIEALNSKIEKFLESKGQGESSTLYAQKYSEKYLYGTYENGRPMDGRIKYIRLFSIIGLLILALACINFTNLSTANASKRIKEIGIKKAAGISRRALWVQFLGEAILMSLLSLAITIPVVLLLIPIFNEVAGTQLDFSFDLKAILGIIAITLLTGVVSGSYPAIYLSRLKPVHTLNGRIDSGKSEFFMRKGLVVFQFVISIVLLIGVLVVSGQVGHIQDTKLGYDKEQLISFPMEGNLDTKYEAFLGELEKINGVASASHMWGDLPGRIGSSSGYQWAGQNEDELKTRFFNISGGYNISELLAVEVLKGRGFSKDFGAEKEGIIFNETAIKIMGYGKDPIGKRVNFEGDKTIIGVVKDFHFESLYEPIKPFFFEIDKGDTFMVRLNSGSERETIAKIERVYVKFNQNIPFEFRFIDENYQALYSSERIVMLLSKYFGGLAILISCLGLFGLALFTAFQKRKEISIRKILGQNISQIVLMLSADFAKLVLVAICIAMPIAYLLTTDWLSDFAYSVPLNIWYFLGTGFIALLVAMLTVGSQALRAANTNPVEALNE